MKKILIVLLTIAGFYASAFDSADNAGDKGAHVINARHAALSSL